MQARYQIPIFACGLLGSFPLFGAATPSTSSRCQEQRIARLEEQVYHIADKNAFGYCQGRNTSNSVEEGFFIDGSFLYMQSTLDNTEYAARTQVGFADFVAGELSATSKVEEIDYKWRPGLQINVGYIFPERSQWDLSLSWTYLHSKANGSSEIPGFDINSDTAALNNLRPFWAPFLLGSVSDQASADWSLHFNTLDLCLGRNLFLGKWFSIHPYAGLRAAWINQNYHADYHSFFQLNTFLVSARNTSFKASNDFKGIGLKFGLGTEWFITPHWSIIGNAAASLLYGKFSVSEVIDGGLITGPTSFLHEVVTLKNRIHRIRPSLEGALGLQWQTFLHEDAFRIHASALYNMAYWFNQNQMLDENITFTPAGNVITQSSPRGGNLQMQGVSVQLGFDF